MIITLLLGLVHLLLELIVLPLPSVDLPFWSSVMAFAPNCAKWLFSLDGVLPIAHYVQTMRWIFTVWFPGFMTYRVSRWVWSHIPVIGS